MKNFSYTKTPELNEQLVNIEDLRRELLLKPISPQSELKLQWQAFVRLIHFSLAINGNIIPEDHIQKLLSPEGKKNLNTKEKEVISYKHGLDYLFHNWLVNDNPITAKDIVSLYQTVFEGSLKSSESEINNALRYIQINPEHPLLQAALAELIILDLYPFSQNNELFSHLVLLMFLYKNGYDFRRMVVVEQLLFNDLTVFRNLIAKMKKQANVTEWLEYMVSNFVQEMTNVIKTITIEKQSPSLIPLHLQLNQRQQQIVNYLSQPGTKISNAIVQEMFNISQITASRDLAKLTSLGLVFPLGKGRSTYYTKV
jgi:Fic family protein